MEPTVLLFDEPTSALDPESTRSLQVLLKDLCKKGVTIVISSHDMPFVASILDSVYFMQQGSIVDSADMQKEQLNQRGEIAQFLS